MKPVFLIGYMGCGKTTLGTALAQEMDLPYIDLDEIIERTCGMSIGSIFEKKGENSFREIERDVLYKVAAMSDVIVGCGGGTPCQGNNMALMNKAGITVWLTTSAERLASRLLLPDEKTKRPIILGLPDNAVLPFIVQQLDERTPYYRQSQMQYDSTDIETAEATTRTARRLARLLKRQA